MFRHKNHAAEEVKKITESPVAVEEHSAKAKDVSPSALRELLEKNLKSNSGTFGCVGCFNGGCTHAPFTGRNDWKQIR